MPERIARSFAVMKDSLRFQNLSVNNPWIEIRFSAVFPSRQSATAALDYSRPFEGRAQFLNVCEMRHFSFRNRAAR